MNKVGNQVKERVEAKVNSNIDNLVAKKVNQLTDKMFKDFTRRKITLTDGYGDKLKVYNSIRDYMKYKFDNFLIEKVDDQGRTSTSTYGTNHKRLDFIVKKQLEEFAEDFTTKAVKQVSSEIKTHVSEGLTKKLGSELMHVLKVDKMLELPKSNN
jgi:homospermidine synthase